LGLTLLGREDFFSPNLKKRVRFIQAIAKYVSGLVLLAMLAGMTNAVLHRHAHRLANGRLVWHAHPYKPAKPTAPDQPEPGHGHQDDYELLMLDLLSNPAFLLSFFAGMILAAGLLPVFATIRVLGWYRATWLAPSLPQISLRGPPAWA
jgi:hypothetical protein